MSKQQRVQKRRAWIMGGMTLLISFFFPHVGGPFSGAFWALNSSYNFSVSPFAGQVAQVVCLFFPACMLIASITWLWHLQVNRDATIFQAFVVTLEAICIAFVATIVFSVVFFVILDTGGWYAARVCPMEPRGWYCASLLCLVFGLNFLVFFPCLLIVAMVLAYFQRKAMRSDMLVSIDVSSGSSVGEH